VYITVIWGKTPCKNASHFHPKQGNLLRRNNFTGLYKALHSQYKTGWRSAEKKSTISSNMLLLGSVTMISMVTTIRTEDRRIGHYQGVIFWYATTYTIWEPC
jgi:hypothetical protein